MTYNKDNLISSSKTTKEDATADVSYIYAEEQLSLLQNKGSKQTEGKFTYYKNGLLRSQYSPLFDFRDLTGAKCFSYSIGETKPQEWDLQFKIDKPFDVNQKKSYKFDKYYNVVFIGVPDADNNLNTIQYLITYRKDVLK